MPGAVRRKLALFVLSLLACSLALAQQAPSAVPIAPGVTYTQERLADGPWEIRIVRVQRGAQYVHIDSALGMGRLKGVERMSGIVRREDAPTDTVVAGVNADFFTMAGNPMAGMVSGLEVRHSELVTMARGRPSFALLKDGTPLIGVFDTAGTVKTAAKELPVTAINEGAPASGIGLITASYGWPITDG